MDSEQHPYLLIVDDDPRVIDFYREALLLPHEDKEQEVDLEMDEMFSLLEGDDPLDLEPEETLGSFCSAEVATHGLDALRIFSQKWKAETPFDLVLLDMRMPPGMDGVETALGLREYNQDLPIIFFTAYSDYSDRQIEEQVGGNYRLLRKPIDHEQLRAEIRQILGDS